MKRIVSFALVIILALALITPAIATTTEGPVHIVQQGDTLWGIARQHDTTWEALAQYNEIANPHMIFPGQEIRIPARLRDLLPPDGYEEEYKEGALPFVSEEVVIGEGTPWPLGGTLTMPSTASGENPVPAVVLVHGSGATDRNLAIGPNQAFYDIAAYLSAHGIAVLRYDKRTYVHNVAQEYGAAFTVWEETIEDAILAANLLREDPRIDPGRVYMAGLSLGGMLAPRIHAQGGDFAGLIIMAGSPRQLMEITVQQERHLIEIGRHQLENMEYYLEIQLEEIAVQLVMLESQIEFLEAATEAGDFAALRAADPVAHDMDDTTAEEYAQALLEAASYLYGQLSAAMEYVADTLANASFDDLYAEGLAQLEVWEEALASLLEYLAAVVDMTAEEAQEMMIGAFPGYYIRDMALNPTPELLAEVTIPMLILQGDNDFQVFADTDFLLYKYFLGGRDNVVFRLYPGLSHIFMPSAAGNLQESLFERDNIPANVYEQVLRDIVEWVLG
ncbi:MAG: alpha/beta fold hydrolase [Defluviitaleaceae bacterium]|nr:alpha/beta fold hydrolase [Defluviitaleaceae bacterium]